MGPYLARLGNLKYLTKNQALQVRTYCLNDFKQTSVDRANNILKDFEKYGKELEKLQSILTQVSFSSQFKQYAQGNSMITIKIFLCVHYSLKA